MHVEESIIVRHRGRHKPLVYRATVLAITANPLTYEVKISGGSTRYLFADDYNLRLVRGVSVLIPKVM